MKTFISTGGLGDSLICLAKIQQKHPKTSELRWAHGTGQKEHFKGISAIQSCSPCINYGVEQINKHTRQAFIDRIIDESEEYEILNTRITEMGLPYLNEPIVKPCYIAPVCIQMTAGRLSDGTKRIVSLKVVEQILKTGKEVVIIGPERIDVTHPKVNNFTGKTESILDALSIVGGSNTFIGQDGVCAYYAAMLLKECYINYHDPGLINHYFNGKWNRVHRLFQGGVLRSLS